MFSGPNLPLRDMKLKEQAREWLTSHAAVNTETGRLWVDMDSSKSPVQKEPSNAVKSLVQPNPGHQEEDG